MNSLTKLLGLALLLLAAVACGRADDDTTVQPVPGQQPQAAQQDAGLSGQEHVAQQETGVTFLVKCRESEKAELKVVRRVKDAKLVTPEAIDTMKKQGIVGADAVCVTQAIAD